MAGVSKYRLETLIHQRTQMLIGNKRVSKIPGTPEHRLNVGTVVLMYRYTPAKCSEEIKDPCPPMMSFNRITRRSLHSDLLVLKFAVYRIALCRVWSTLNYAVLFWKSPPAGIFPTLPDVPHFQI